MHLRVLLIFVLLSMSTAQHFASDKELKPEWKKYYSSYKGEACFILYDLNKDKYYIYNESRVNKGFLPASIFKIFNSLAALETGAAIDENEVIKWDGIDRGREAWNKDHNMKSAFKVSAVWFYQELARRIGKNKMQHLIDSAHFGNMDINDKIDDFWLRGKLRVTPMEQLEFLKQLYKEDLPFSERSIKIVKEIMINEQDKDFILRAKTGWADGEGFSYGWWVGYLETKDNVYFFVNNMDIVNEGDENGRIEVTKNILRDLGLYNSK